jgi:hypothetical protein
MLRGKTFPVLLEPEIYAATANLNKSFANLIISCEVSIGRSDPGSRLRLRRPHFLIVPGGALKHGRNASC